MTGEGWVMDIKLGRSIVCLYFGIFLALCAHAEEHKAPAASATKAASEEKSAAAAKNEPSAKTKGEGAKAETAKVDTAKIEAPAPAPAPARTAIPARRQIDIQPRPIKRPAPQRLAMANTAIAEKAPEPAPAPAAHDSHWSYEGANGPQAWAKLSPEYAKCGSGERQSPIDIRDGMKVDLEQIAFEYRPSSFKVIDNGHTIQANVGGWNSMRVMGRRFRLVQFHFHRPSEEAIDGRQFEMVVHMVHKDSEDRLAVVAVLIEGGARQPAIQAVLNNLPLEKGTEAPASVNVDPSQILPENRRYFTYMGSLTTPPCSEDVLWIVMKQPVQASAEQLDLFARMYPMNARPIQSAAGRTIKESN